MAEPAPAVLPAEGTKYLPEEEPDTVVREQAAPREPAPDPWLSPVPDTRTHAEQAQLRKRMASVCANLVDEGIRQVHASVLDTQQIRQETAEASRSILRRCWRFLAQPVWIPGRHRTPKQYSRGTLFLIDTVRFGGTFAGLFLVLFTALNYQSFWAIAQSYVAPLAEVTTPESLPGNTPGTRTPALPAVPATVSPDGSTSVLDLLPPVGPPDDRILIPKLDLNVPIVIPPRTALLAEDWKQLEEDIQRSLQDGVVHYPGTAVPGQAGNFFITGHSSYFPWAPGSFKSVFARLGELHVGDEYWVYYGGDRYRYVIREKKEIKPSDVSVLDQPLSERIGTLMTCTPVGTTLRRLILVAQEVDPVSGEPLAVGEHRKGPDVPKVRMDMLPI